MKDKSKRNRQLAVKLFDHRYQYHYSKFPGCFYCGDIAQTIDHCPPISFCSVADIAWFKKNKIKFYKVQCCMSCNTRLSNRKLFRLQDRTEYITRRLEIEAEKFVIWSKEEVKEMSPMFQKMIKGKQAMHNALMARIRFSQELLCRPQDFPEEE